MSTTDLIWGIFALNSKLYSHLWRCPVEYHIPTAQVAYTNEKKALIPWILNITIVLTEVGATAFILLRGLLSPAKSEISFINYLILIIIKILALITSALAYCYFRHGGSIAVGVKHYYNLVNVLRNRKFSRSLAIFIFLFFE